MLSYQSRSIVFILFFQNIFVGGLNAEGLEVTFVPSSPVIHLKNSTNVDGVTVYDHSKFSIKLTNRHHKPINIKSVNFISIGDIQKSGLGDIINYWPWEGSHTLKPKQWIWFDKVWGFTEDTPNKTMKYRFEFTYSVEGKSKNKLLVKELTLKPDS